MTQLLEAIDISKIFVHRKGKTTRALEKINLSFSEEKPDIISIVGESGSGKTTFARIILGLLPPTTGRILFKGKDITSLTHHEWAEYRRQIQAVFQDPYGIYNPFYRVDRVLENTVKKFRLASSREESKRLISESLEAIGLRPNEILGRYPHQLSGGERQRIMLARLYLLKPKLIIADEPISMIDVALRALFLNILLDFKQKYGMSCLFITHDLSSSYYLGEKVVILYRGKVMEKGETEEILKKPFHPYTKLLMEALLPPDPEKKVLLS
ncbi:MAG: ABC transporter ATP-binding protein, partial [bacterium]